MRRIQIAPIVISLLLAAATTISLGFQGQSATSSEVLSRLEKLLIQHGSRASGGYIRRFEPREFRNCKISYELVPQLRPDHQGYVPFTERISFSLTELDPKTVTINEGKDGVFLVGFRTMDQKQSIETRHAQESHAFGDPHYSNAHSFVVTNQPAAEEIKSSLAQAITLCK